MDPILLGAIFITPIAAIIIIGLIWYQKWNHTFKDLQHIKGPTPLPIVGNMSELGDPTSNYN